MPYTGRLHTVYSQKYAHGSRVEVFGNDYTRLYVTVATMCCPEVKQATRNPSAHGRYDNDF